MRVPTESRKQAGRTRQTREIVVGVDGSDGSKQALRWCLDEAQRCHLAVRVVHAWVYTPMYSRVPYVPDLDSLRDRATQILESAVADVVRDDQRGNVECVTLEGRPAEVLIETARDAEMLVVGSGRQGVFRTRLLGPVAEDCARHAKCSVVIVRAPHHEDRAEGAGARQSAEDSSF
jgi:nucleotide-binding universal stress UspA family protein